MIFILNKFFFFFSNKKNKIFFFTLEDFSSADELQEEHPFIQETTPKSGS
jgi:hypothetical protein